MGKSFQYWQCLYDEGIIESHVINLRLQHLKYAFDGKLITDKEYETHIHMANQCHIKYKPCSLMDFTKALKIHNITNQLEIIQSSKIDQHLEKMCTIQKTIKVIPENINQLHKASKPFPIIEEETNIYQTNTKKKSRKKRKKKKKSIYALENIINNSNNEKIEIFKDEYLINSEKSTKQNLASKHPVKVFVRRGNKKFKSDTVCSEPLISSKQKTVRDVFSAILKQYKMERQNRLQSQS